MAKVQAFEGQCRLKRDSNTVISLNRERGTRVPVKVGGVWVAEPVAATPITLNISALTPDTLHFIYGAGDPLAMEASTTVYDFDADLGVAIKTADPTRTLLGMLWTIDDGGGGSFVKDEDTQRHLINWFQRRAITARRNTALYASRTNAAYGEMDSAFVISWLLWAGDIPEMVVDSSAGSDVASDNFVALAPDGTPGAEVYIGLGGGNFMPVCIHDRPTGLSEGRHELEFHGKSSGTVFVGGNQTTNKINSTLATTVWG